MTNHRNTPNAALLYALSTALSMIHSLAELTKSPPINVRRFETIKHQILSLPLPEFELQRNRSLLESASRYVEYGEIGAVNFELKLVSRNLQKLQGADQFRTTI